MVFHNPILLLPPPNPTSTTSNSHRPHQRPLRQINLTLSLLYAAEVVEGEGGEGGGGCQGSSPTLQRPHHIPQQPPSPFKILLLAHQNRHGHKIELFYEVGQLFYYFLLFLITGILHLSPQHLIKYLKRLNILFLSEKGLGLPHHLLIKHLIRPDISKRVVSVSLWKICHFRKN